MITRNFSDLVASGDLQFGDGYRTKRTELASSGYRILRAGDIDSNTSGRATDFVDERYAPNIGARQVRTNDVALTTKGTVGRVAMIGRLDELLVYSPQICYFRMPDEGALRREFLRYWFGSQEFLHQCSHLMSSTDMAPYLSLRDIGSLKITLPSERNQQSIAAVLGALDDKIAMNDAINSTAENLIAAETRRACTKAFRLASVEEVARFLNRRRIPLSSQDRRERKGTVPYYGATGPIDTVDKAIFDEPLTLVGEDGSVVKDDGTPFVQYIWGPSWVNNHAHVLVGEVISTELLNILLQAADVRPLVTGAVQPKLSMGKLKSLLLKIPTGEDLATLENLTRHVYRLRRSLAAESRTLTDLRDTLLPALISGRLRVKDAERHVEDALY